MITGRNDPCPCGSVKKYKKCCGNLESSLPDELQQQKTNATVRNKPKIGTYPAQDLFNQLVALYNAGQYAELERRAYLLVDTYPDYGLGWKLLSASLLMQNKDTLLALQMATKLLPDEAELHNNLGHALAKHGRHVEAEASFRRALRIKPTYADAHYNLGTIFHELGRLDEAESSYRLALQFKPDCADLHINLGNALHKMDRLAEAESSYRNALRFKSDHAEALNNLGKTLYEMGHLEEAESSLRCALNVNPEIVDVHLNLSGTLLDQGRFAEAEDCLRRALVIKPGFTEAIASMAYARKVKVDDKNLEAMISSEEASHSGAIPLTDADTVLLNFALGKSYDDIGDHEKAFSYFLKGCMMKRASLVYDENETDRRFASVKRNFDEETMDRLRGGGDPSPVPIFVLGMPRSGTTLTEQIIASHPEVHGAGELLDLMAIARRKIAGTSFPDNMRLLNQARLTNWGAEYVAGLQRLAPDAHFITDKMPANFFAVGLIHLMLPNAKIVHVNRNPVDTCLSCFTQLFRFRHEHTYDLAELGRYYVGYARLMEHWRKVLPHGAFLDVRYEDIVADQEAQSRRLIEYCGLEWSDACLDFHQSKRAVRTASVTQVRQPMYQSSVERWRNYEKFLGPLFEALGDSAPGRH